MSARPVSPLANRICAAIAVFTFASWTVLAAALFAWAPARDLLGRRVASAAARIFPSELHASVLTLGNAPTAFLVPELGEPAGAAFTDAEALAPEAAALDETPAPEEMGCSGNATSPTKATSSSSSTSGCSGDGDATTSVDYSYGYSDEDSDFSWTVTTDGDDVFSSGPRARMLCAHAGHEPAFWFRENGDSYVVRDAALVSEARRASEPLSQVSREMGALGGEMGRHGAAMGRLGGKMGAIGARIARLELRIASRVSAESAAAMREQTSELRSELSRLQEQLSDQQAEHASRQRELSRRMSVLSAKHQRVWQEVRAKLREIARRALREGKAERPHANA